MSIDGKNSRSLLGIFPTFPVNLLLDRKIDFQNLTPHVICTLRSNKAIFWHTSLEMELCGAEISVKCNFSTFFSKYLNNFITFLDSQWFVVKSLMVFRVFNLREIASFFITSYLSFHTYFLFVIAHKLGGRSRAKNWHEMFIAYPFKPLRDINAKRWNSDEIIIKSFLQFIAQLIHERSLEFRNKFTSNFGLLSMLQTVYN